jgi:hypothetical protein
VFAVCEGRGSVHHLSHSQLLFSQRIARRRATEVHTLSLNDGCDPRYCLGHGVKERIGDILGWMPLSDASPLVLSEAEKK